MDDRGDGVVHSEMPSTRIQTEGGRVHGFRVWVNLPADAKRIAPNYQGLEPSELTVVEGDGWTARVVAGELLGGVGPATTHTPIAYGHLTVEPGATVDVDVADDHVAGLYAFRGAGSVGPEDTTLQSRALAVFDRGRGGLRVRVADDAIEPLDALVLTGRPLGEPVARYGPFVMNTRDELIEAIEDFQAGRMGHIAATGRA